MKGCVKSGQCEIDAENGGKGGGTAEKTFCHRRLFLKGGGVFFLVGNGGGKHFDRTFRKTRTVKKAVFRILHLS